MEKPVVSSAAAVTPSVNGGFTPEMSRGARLPTSTGTPLALRIVVIAVILLVVCVRVRLRSVPLERDEGEYAYTGQLMLQGIPPFRLASNMKMPGTHAAYAVSMAIFGESASGVHLGLLVANLITVTLLFFLARRLFGGVAGWVTAASYALLSVGVRVHGTSADATHFVVLFATAGCLLLLVWSDYRRPLFLVWSGLSLGLAFMMKQPGVFFVVFGAIYILLKQRRKDQLWRIATALRDLGIFSAAASVPLGITCLIIWRAGLFPRFWFWTVAYAHAYISIKHLSPKLVQMVFHDVRILIWSEWPLWLFAGIGGGLLWASRASRAPAAWITAFLFFSTLAICPGLYFRPHYFVLLLPAVAMLAGAGVQLARQYLPQSFLTTIVALGFLICIFHPRRVFFRSDNTQVSKLLYHDCPFPESKVVGDYIRTHSSQEARVAVLGSEPEIYFYAQRHSATDYIYTYPLLEPQPLNLQMQEEMISQIASITPEYLVEVHVYTSWLVRPSSPRRIFEWFADYCPKHYNLVGIVDIISDNATIYRWDDAVVEYKPRSDSFIRVFKRV